MLQVTDFDKDTLGEPTRQNLDVFITHHPPPLSGVGSHGCRRWAATVRREKHFFRIISQLFDTLCYGLRHFAPLCAPQDLAPRKSHRNSLRSALISKTFTWGS